ncbi:SUMO-activating enzyme subunit 1-like [Babylonia areolata]|uniref:SUMO-activating enzyme subunit 1-like n=1 Tax=Babylonia areolata TaxID=304850 RepID=UPI003FCEFF7A
MTAGTKEENITEDEAALYDRQIRLWGLDAQKRLRAASVLLIGLRGLGAEVAKNIVLAGIKSLTLLDPTVADEEDAAAQFLIPRSEIGKNRAEASLERTQALNPMVTVTADTSSIEDKDDDFVKSFDVVCATGCGTTTLTRLDRLCREGDVKFYAGDVFGFFGFMFADLGTHEFAKEVKKPKAAQKPVGDEGEGEPSAKKAKVEEEPETYTVKQTMTFPTLEGALGVKFDTSTPEGKKKLRQTPNTFFITKVMLEFVEQQKRSPLTSCLESDSKQLSTLRDKTLESFDIAENKLPQDFTQYCFGQLSPVCAVVGGIIGQEIIKAVSQKDAPHNNFFFYNGTDDGGFVITLGS